MDKSNWRKRYLAREITHDEFYQSVVKMAGISYENSSILSKIKAALKAGDKHLNTIPLSYWDIRAIQTRPLISKALKAHGTFYSLAGGVSTHKQAAKMAATK